MKRKSYVFIDRQVSDYDQLLAHVKADTTVVLLDGDRDGVAQISEVLEQQQGVAEIHLVSHGSPDCLQLGATRLSLNNMAQYANLVQQWRGAIAQSMLVIPAPFAIAPLSRYPLLPRLKVP